MNSETKITIDLPEDVVSRLELYAIITGATSPIDEVIVTILRQALHEQPVWPKD